MSKKTKGLWIPIEIQFNEELSPAEKMILANILSFDMGEGCYASNEYFGKLTNKSKQWVSVIIRRLKEKKYISVQYVIKNKNVEKRMIKIIKKK